MPDFLLNLQKYKSEIRKLLQNIYICTISQFSCNNISSRITCDRIWRSRRSISDPIKYCTSFSKIRQFEASYQNKKVEACSLAIAVQFELYQFFIWLWRILYQIHPFSVLIFRLTSMQMNHDEV